MEASQTSIGEICTNRPVLERLQPDPSQLSGTGYILKKSISKELILLVPIPAAQAKEDSVRPQLN